MKYDEFIWSILLLLFLLNIVKSSAVFLNIKNTCKKEYPSLSTIFKCIIESFVDEQLTQDFLINYLNDKIYELTDYDIDRRQNYSLKYRVRTFLEKIEEDDKEMMDQIRQNNDIFKLLNLSYKLTWEKFENVKLINAEK